MATGLKFLSHDSHKVTHSVKNHINRGRNSGFLFRIFTSQQSKVLMNYLTNIY